MNRSKLKRKLRPAKSYVVKSFHIYCLIYSPYLFDSENRLSLPDSLSEYAQAFFKVHTVYMNRMDYSWEEVRLVFNITKVIHLNLISILRHLFDKK